MVFAAANCAAPVQRPCSTQKTSRGSGGAPTGTMRSLPMTRSCLPPLLLLAGELVSGGKKQKRAAAAIDQNKLVDGSAGVVLRKINGTAVTRTLQDLRALLGDGDFAGRETFLERKKRTGVLTLGADDREDGDVFIDDGVEQSPFALWPGRK